MAIFLQILGALFLTMILGIIVLFLVIRAKARRFFKTLGDLAEQAQNATATAAPARIHLVPMAVNDWDDPEAVSAQTEPLASLGFEKVGDFEVEPVDGLRLEAWVQPREIVAVVVYEHPKAGVWIDYVTRFEDGSSITYANSTMGSAVDHAPGHTVERFPGMDPTELYRKFLADRPQGPAKAYTASNFVEMFEKAYADEMDWRNARGGPTEREMRAIAALSGGSYSDEQIESAREALQTQALEQLAQTLREKFLVKSGMPAAEWERIRDRVVVVHDKLTDEMVGDILYEHGDEEDAEQFDFDSDGPARERFKAYNALLPAQRQYRLLGTLDEPIEANVYCAPE